ncbi:target of rapamycin complex 2 subunit Tsc11p [Monosporozyma unispora]
MNEDSKPQERKTSHPISPTSHHYNASNIRKSIYDPSTISNNTSTTSTTNTNIPNKNNLVLSTSFVRTRRNDPNNTATPNSSITSPTSPLLAGFPKTSITKSRQNLKLEIEQVEQELEALRNKKQDTERLKNTSETGIFSGTYSTEHLQKHSQRIKTNTQIREIDMNLKKLEKQLDSLKNQYQMIKTNYSSMNSLDDSDDDSSFDVDSSNSRNGSFKAVRKIRTNSSSRTPELINFPDMDDYSPHVESKRVNSLDLHNKLSADTTSTKNDSDVFLTPKKSHPKETYFDSSSFDDSRSDEKSELSQYTLKDKSEAAAIESATWYISDYMESLQESDVSEEFILNKANSLIEVLRDHPELRKDLVLTSFMKTIESLFTRDDSLISAATYRICRYLINGQEFITSLVEMGIDKFMDKSLDKDDKHQTEREQALKLIRRMSDYENGITTDILQILINCIEKNTDILRITEVETLLELCVKTPKIVNECQGIHVLSKLLQECSSFALSSIIEDAILNLMENPRTRKYYIKDFDITVLSAVFSDMNTKKTLNIEKLQNITILITRALKNYAGFMLYCMNNFKPIKELLIFFQVPLCAHYLIDMFLDILTIKPLSLKGRAKNALFKPKPSKLYRDSVPSNQFLALVIMVLDICKFEDHITELINYNLKEESHNAMLMKARFLLSEYLNLRMNLLNKGSVPVLQKSENTDLVKNQEIFHFSKVVNNLNRNRNTMGMSDVDIKEQFRKYTKSIKDNSLVTTVDDIRFRKMVFDSKVLQTKDFSLWNWNIIQELLEGPLMNKRQLEELARSTKFIRRLLVFYRPLRLRFSNVDKGTRLSQRYIQVGCKFFKMLTTNPEGMRIFTEDTKIVPQLASLLYRAMEGNVHDNIFSEKTLKTKIVDGYFKFVGVLTETLNGIKILTRWNFFTVIYKMFQPGSHIGTKFLMLTLPELNLLYSIHCRTIIGKALTASQETLRIRTTRYVGNRLNELSKNDISSTTNNRSNNGLNYDSTIITRLQKFKLELLTRQLYDLCPDVVAIADKALYEYILNSGTTSESKFSIKTFLNQMVFIRSPILFELLGKPFGFKLLNEINFVEQERRSWIMNKNKEYVIRMEQFLSSGQSSLSIYGSKEYDVGDKLPLHFYESLAKTEGGISLLSQSGDLLKSVNILKRYVSILDNGQDNDSVNNANIDPIEIKSMLWCNGYIGSTVLGISLLDNYSSVEDIVRIAYDSKIISIKFTAFFALGLISKTREGCEILDELGWNCTLNVMAKPMGVVLPLKLDKFLSFKEREWSNRQEYKDETLEFYVDSNTLVRDTKTKIINYNLDALLTERDCAKNLVNIDKNEYHFV